MTFEEFKEKYKDVNIKEFFPLWEDGGVVGDIHFKWCSICRIPRGTFYVGSNNKYIFENYHPDLNGIIESSYFSEGCKSITFKQLLEQYEQKQKQKEKFVNHVNIS